MAGIGLLKTHSAEIITAAVLQLHLHHNLTNTICYREMCDAVECNKKSKVSKDEVNQYSWQQIVKNSDFGYTVFDSPQREMDSDSNISLSLCASVVKLVFSTCLCKI